MHRAVGQLLLDRIDLAVKPIPELSAHLQGMPIRIDFLSIERIASAVNVLQILIVQRHHNALKRSFDRCSRLPLSALLLIIAAALGMHLVHEIAAFYGVSVDYLLGNADSKEKQPDSQNENQAVKDELIAFYGDVKDDLTPDDIDDLMVAMRTKAERNKKKKSGV